MALQETPVYRALHRSLLFLGAERSPGIGFVGLVGCAEYGAFMGHQWPLMAALVAVLFFGLWLGRSVAKKDPQWFAMFGQRWRLRPFYLANSTPYRKDRMCPNVSRFL
jgi:type IV secretory pathway TrbD component